MPRDGAITFDDVYAKLNVLRVICEKCGRAGRYNVSRLIERRGANSKIVDLLSDLKTEFPRAASRNFFDRCGANCPDLPRVM